jgi:hypothetical protein
MTTMKTMTFTQQALQMLIADAVAQGIRAYEAGKGGEVSYRQGVKLYGAWFADAVEKGHLSGLRRGAGKNSKIVYQKTDIEALRTAEIAETSKILHTIHTK